MLVADTGIGTHWLRFLHRIGQSATPRRNEELAALARTALGDTIELRREGSMAYLRSH